MRKEMPAKVGDDALGNPCSQIAMAHRTEPLQDDESEKDGDQVRHPGLVVLHGDDVPQGAGQPQQGQIDGGDTHDQQACQHHAGQVGLQEREKS